MRSANPTLLAALQTECAPASLHPRPKQRCRLHTKIKPAALQKGRKSQRDSQRQRGHTQRQGRPQSLRRLHAPLLVQPMAQCVGKTTAGVGHGSQVALQRAAQLGRRPVTRVRGFRWCGYAPRVYIRTRGLYHNSSSPHGQRQAARTYLPSSGLSVVAERPTGEPLDLHLNDDEDSPPQHHPQQPDGDSPMVEAPGGVGKAVWREELKQHSSVSSRFAHLLERESRCPAGMVRAPLHPSHAPPPSHPAERVPVRPLRPGVRGFGIPVRPLCGAPRRASAHPQARIAHAVVHVSIVQGGSRASGA